MVIGVDKGTTYTKTSDRKHYKSTIRKVKDNEIFLKNQSNVFEVDGVKYLIGSDGHYGTDLMKASQVDTKIMVLYALANSVEKDYLLTDLVTGLPIGLYSEHKNNLRSTFENTKHFVKLNNNNILIRIDRCIVFPESAGAYFSQNEYKNCLIIDVGGLSVDISLFHDDSLKQYSTIQMGIMRLYSKIANHINSKYDTNLFEWDIEDIINKGLYICGEKQELNLEEIILEHSLKIYERLKMSYELQLTSDVLFCGGASKILFPYFKNPSNKCYMKQAKMMNDYFFANAIGYKRIGMSL